MTPATFLTLAALTMQSMPGAKKALKSTKKPTFKFPLEKLMLPTLESCGKELAIVTRAKIYKYSEIYSTTLLKHLENETEVQLVQGELTVESRKVLNDLESEMEILQFRKYLKTIMEPWENMLGGQPSMPEVANLISAVSENVVVDFEVFIYELQAKAIKNRRFLNNSLCNSVCNSNTRILNLTKTKIPEELAKALANGTNFVPLDELKINDIKTYIEKDLISAAVNFFREENKVYPLINNAAGLKTVLEQLISQSPSNSPQIEFYTSMYNQYVGKKQEFF